MSNHQTSKQPSIMHLGKFYPPYKGGIETHVRDLAVRQVRSASVDVVVANTLYRNEISVSEGVRLTRVASVGSVASMPICPGMTRMIRRFPADLVHIHVPNPGAAFSFLKSRHPGKLVITHHADTLGRKLLRRISDPYVREIMDRAAAIVVTSRRYLDSSDELQSFRDKCHVIPLGIVPPTEADLHAEPARLPVLADCIGPVILAVGRFVPYKGFDVLIRAMKRIDATLVLIGDGPQQPQLSALTLHEGVSSKVKMLGRVADLGPYFRAASLFVLPSVTRAEAFGLVQAEAMAFGLPIVNTNIDSGVPEVSLHGHTGLTVEPGDPAALADAIEFLLGREDLRASFGRNARERVSSEFTVELMAERTAELYRRVLESR